MLAAVWTDYNKMEIRELPTPEIGADDVLVRVMAAGVCITDLHVYSGQFAYGRPPHVLGHEIAGCVESVGANVNRWKKGDRVTVETSIGCGRCRFCRSGQRHLCPELTEIGFSPNPGGYAQFVRVPEDNLVRIPDGVSYEEAGIVESVVCPIAALMRLKVTFGETAAVYGVGPAGLAFIQGLKALGAGKVIAVARDDFRLARAMSFGADVVVNARSEDALKRIREETDGLGADIVCEAAGAPSTIEEAFQAVRSAGRVILYGIPGGRVWAWRSTPTRSTGIAWAERGRICGRLKTGKSASRLSVRTARFGCVRRASSAWSSTARAPTTRTRRETPITPVLSTGWIG